VEFPNVLDEQTGGSGGRDSDEGGYEVGLVFESPVAATGKKPQPGRTESQKTGPPVAVFTGCESVAVAVFCNFNYLKLQATGQNRLQPTTV
jgi:hypothetical protein